MLLVFSVCHPCLPTKVFYHLNRYDNFVSSYKLQCILFLLLQRIGKERNVSATVAFPSQSFSIWHRNNYHVFAISSEYKSFAFIVVRFKQI